ncbi:MAG: GH39 family glycosyl hydrolase [Chloroflexota bacterium]
MRQSNPALRSTLIGVAGAVALVTAGLTTAWQHRTASGSAPLTAAPSPSGNTILVNPKAVKRVIPADFFGINYVALWDKAQGSAASARALAQTPIRTVRFPGGVPGDYYDWQDPYYKHWTSTSPSQVWEWTKSFGGKRVLYQTSYPTQRKQPMPNPPGQSYAVDSPQNAAAWVAYAKAQNIPADMEVGNEEDVKLLHGKNDPHYAQYIDQFNAQARAMHAVDSHIRVLGPAAANAYYWWAWSELATFLHGTGNRTGTGQVDGVSLHYYSGSSWYDSKGIPQRWLSRQGPWYAIKKMIHANDTRALPVYLTEWNLGHSDFHNTFTPTLGHDLAIADMTGALALSGVAGEDYFALHGASGWGLLYGLGEKRPVDSPTPTYYAMALWRHMSRDMLATQQSDDAAAVMSSYATRGKNGSLQVLAINKMNNARRVTVEFQHATPKGHHLKVYTLQGSTNSISDLSARYDGRVDPSPQETLPGPAALGTVHGRTVTYTVPAFSAVVLDLDGVTSARNLTWRAIPKARPAPPAKFAVSGSISSPHVAAAGTETLTAVAKSNQDIGPAVLDLEVYNSNGKKAFQNASTVTLTANTPVTVTHDFTLKGGAPSGEYHYKIGLFAPGWSSLLAWDNTAGSFSVGG